MKLQLVLSLVLLSASGSLSAQTTSAVSVSLRPQEPGTEVGPSFTGLSFEVHLVLPDENGRHYFRPDNRALISLFHRLGVRSLRIGGNTSDRNAGALPGAADLDSLFTFARAAGVKVIYCLRLRGGDPSVDAQTVRYILDRYADAVDCFSIGQEPSAYPSEKADTRPASERMGAAAEKYPYSSYASDWRRFAIAILAANPGARFCGPGVHNNPDWARRFIADFGRGNRVCLVTEHLYPGGAGDRVRTPEIGRDRMLSAEFTKVCQKLHDGFALQAAAAGLPYRLEEVNNYFNGGAANVSNTFASALWGLDFMAWWAQHGAAGVNFHTGDRVAAGDELRASKYTAFFTAEDGYRVRPLGYGIAAFDLGSHGRVIPAVVSANPDQVSLSVYAVAASDGSVAVTLINKEHGPSGRSVLATLSTGGGAFRAQTCSLVVPNSDVAAVSGITLGGAPINDDASWAGVWSDLPPTSGDGRCAIPIPAASATIVRITNERP